MKVQILRSGAQYCFRIVARNDRTLCHSERYWNKADCRNAIANAAGGGAGSAVPAARQLAGRDQGPHQPPQARLWPAAYPAVPPGRCPYLVGLGIFAYNLQPMTVVDR